MHKTLPRTQDGFLSLVRKTDACWIWLGSKDRNGYGRVFRNKLAHRHAFEIFVGAIPVALTIDHLCRNRACVNPLHLEAVSKRINTLRGQGPAARNALKSHCPQGHPYDAANTYVAPDGGRNCRRCNAQSAAAYKGRRVQP
jgi:hypothetical protein